MREPQPNWDASIIGAGIVGLAAARKFAGEGGRVTVVERERIGAEASSAAAGLLAQTEAEPDQGPSAGPVPRPSLEGLTC